MYQAIWFFYQNSVKLKTIVSIEKKITDQYIILNCIVLF